jgi:DNA-binding MarR family transcriptional regulator
MPRLNQSDYEALAAFRYAVRQFQHFSEAAAESVGLTPQQHQALLAIKGFPEATPITISQLAERLQIRHHSAVGLIDRLVAQKFVIRKTSSQDRRQVHGFFGKIIYSTQGRIAAYHPSASRSA